MNENIDLTKILKYCPEGWKLYSTIFGEVKFNKIEERHKYPIVFITIYGTKCETTAEGKHQLQFDGECTLFPSQDQRDWSKFTAPWYKKEMDTIARIEKQDEPNPYSGVSFKYNGHTWGMCARDNGVEILVDGEIKERILLLDNKPQGKQTNEREWLYLVSDVLTWKDGIGQYLDDPRVQELAKRLCSEYVQKLYNPSNTGKNEQKSADKIAPRFKVGDWVVRGDTIAQIVDIQKQYYVGLDINGKDFVSSRFLNGDKIHLWTIQDAKDGDVLALSWLEDKNLWAKIVIFKKYHSEGVKGLYNMPCVEGYGITFKNGKTVFNERIPYYSKTWTCNLHPATKEQRDLLLQKMKEAGYKWTTETNTFEKLVEPKFDPKTLKPFDKVLVKDFDETSYWRCNLFSHYNKNKGYYYCSSAPFDVCIPYNDDTKHLVGTTEEAPKFYKYWED